MDYSNVFLYGLISLLAFCVLVPVSRWIRRRIGEYRQDVEEARAEVEREEARQAAEAIKRAEAAQRAAEAEQKAAERAAAKAEREKERQRRQAEKLEVARQLAEYRERELAAARELKALQCSIFDAAPVEPVKPQPDPVAGSRNATRSFEPVKPQPDPAPIRQDATQSFAPPVGIIRG